MGKIFNQQYLISGLRHYPICFQNVGGYNMSIGGTFSYIRAKLIFVSFEIKFMVISVLFIEHWRLFFLNLTYDCKYTFKLFYLQVFKLGLRQYPFSFQNIGGYFSSIGGTVANIVLISFSVFFKIRFTAFSVLFLENI